MMITISKELAETCMDALQRSAEELTHSLRHADNDEHEANIKLMIGGHEKAEAQLQELLENCRPLTAERVCELFSYCNTDNNPHAETISITGVRLKVDLDKKRLNEKKDEIEALARDLPDEFKEGWSFLNLCIDKRQRQWADLHETMDKLVILCLGVGAMDFTMPQELWPALPGGMPYVHVLV